MLSAQQMTAPSYDDIVPQFNELRGLYQSSVRKIQAMKDIDKRNKWIMEKIAAIPNNRLDWVTKGVVIGISQEFVRMGVPHTQLTKVWYPNISDQCGLSQDSIKSGVSKLWKAKAIIKQVKCDPNSKNRRVWLAFTPEFLVEPAVLFPEGVESNHGGKRVKKHRDCGGMITNVCDRCGVTDIPKSEIYYEDEQEAQRNAEELQRMDDYIENTPNLYDASDMDDQTFEKLGGTSEALKAPVSKIRQLMTRPVHERYDVEQEDMDFAWDVAKEMRNNHG